jgi:two-component system, cell cycle response regulator
VLVYGSLQGIAGTSVWLAAATLVTVLARLLATASENLRLIASSRELADRDALTGLGNRRVLLADLEHQATRATASDPTLLLLFDLNGFKRYNDTFGHPAGDKMLAKLGHQLGTAVGSEEATVYRLGGDEFLVLAEGGLVDLGMTKRDALAARSAEALSARGSGFDVSAAWGFASVPEEADSPAEAMRLADVRMYAQKESRRLAGPLGAFDREALEQSH